MFGQIINAVVTPFDNENQIDFDCFGKLLHELEKDHTTIVLAGSTGEGHSLSIPEKEKLINYVIEHSKLKIILGISESYTDKAIEEIEHFSSFALAAFLVMTPSVYLPTQRGLYLHYKALAAHTFSIPIIIYNIPKRTGCNIKYSTLRKLIISCPNIVGIKEASNDANMIELIKKNYPKFLVYVGNDGFFLEGLEAGADGVISVMSVYYSSLMINLINDFKFGFKNQTLSEYIKLISSILGCESNPIPIKYFLNHKGYPSMNLRLPLTEISLEGKEQVDIILK